MNKTPPLLLDAMLGELAKWLRLMGYDARFVPDTPDLVIVRLARKEGRTVLTQDRALSRSKAISAVFIQSDDLDQQIVQVQQEIGPPNEPVQPRCGVCNTVLESVNREAVQNRVPPYVWRTNDSFTECTTCNRVYWKGTHWEGISQKLEGRDEGSISDD